MYNDEDPNELQGPTPFHYMRRRYPQSFSAIYVGKKKHACTVLNELYTTDRETWQLKNV
jgi:hypothetical protein